MRLSPLAIAAALSLAPSAFADDATVSVGHDFARPPRPPERVIVVEDPPPPPSHDYVVNTDPLPHEIYRSPFRLGVGPYGVTTGRGLGLGMGVHADIGTGTVGVRVAAAWLRGEPQGDSLVMPATGTSMGQYTAEIVLDMHKNGPFHPLLGLGVGLLHIAKNDISGDAAIGVARLGIEYSLGLDDADVRLGVSIMGAMPGAADRELADLRAYGMLNSTITIGF